MKLVELGITILPEYIQSDGVEPALETLADRVGVTSVTTSPYVAAPAAPGEGHREPPIDGGDGKDRLLDRPLWGRREVWMTAASSFRPDPALYQGLRYRPPEADALTDEEGPAVGAFLDAARARGLEAWMQIQAAIPPCHRVQFGGPHANDQCLMPDGSPVTGRVDKNASLASEDLRSYQKAFVTDLCRAYPQVDGFRFDWPEYPAYHFESLFFDFNPAAARFAPPLGLDSENLRKGCQAVLDDLSSGAVRRKAIALDSWMAFRDSLFAAYPVLSDLLAYRTAIVSDYARFLQDTVMTASGGRSKVFLQTFPPPLNALTGFDLSETSRHCDVIGVKFYTMHWPLIERNYIAALTSRTDFAPRDIARAISAILSLSPRTDRDPDTIRYPGPDEDHPGDDADILTKAREARAAIGEDTRMMGLTHAYGPVSDMMRRFAAVAEGTNGAVHVNRFGYMSEEKLDAIGSRVAAPMRRSDRRGGPA